MKVWVLEWFCSDTDDYQFIDVFESFAGIISYLEKSGDPESGNKEFTMDIEEGQVKIWNSDYYLHKNKRTHRSMDKSDFIASERKVR